MAQNNIKDTTHLLVYGHEGWLEEYPSHYHLGDPGKNAMGTQPCSRRSS